MRPETCLVQSLKEKGIPSTKPQVLVVGKELCDLEEWVRAVLALPHPRLSYGVSLEMGC